MHSQSLLPTLDFKLEIEINCLLEYNGLHLIRRVDDTLDNVYNSALDVVRTIAFCSYDNNKTIELPGMSMNLLCLKCDENSTDYKTKGRGSDYWDGETIFSEEEIPDLCEPCGPHINIYIPMDEVHGTVFDTVILKQGDTVKKLHKEEKEYTSTIIDGREFLIVKGGGILEIRHKPTMLNYWHFELECQIDGKSIKRKQNTTEKSSLTLLIDQIFSMITKINIPEPKDIDPKTCYLTAS